MEVFYDYLGATAGIIVGVFGTVFAIGVGSIIVILGLAKIIGFFKKPRPSAKVVRPTFGNGIQR